MKILHLIDSGGLYGAESVLLTLMEGQRALGLQPVLGSMGDHGQGEKPIEVEARRRRLDVIALRARDAVLPVGAFRLVSTIRRGGFDVVHSHGYKPSILLALVPRSFRRFPVVATVHGWCAGPGWSRLAGYEGLERRILHRLDASVFVAASSAQSAGVLPDLSRAVASAPWARRVSIASFRFSFAARCSGVMPPLSRALTSALALPPASRSCARTPARARGRARARATRARSRSSDSRRAAW